MNKKRIFTLTLILVVLLSAVTTVHAAKGKPMGSFPFKPYQPGNTQLKGYVPVDEVASVLGFEFDWRLHGNKVRGRFRNRNFSSDNYIIAYGHLYLPLDFFLVNFKINIVIRGDRYYIYGYDDYERDLELTIKTNKTNYSVFDSLAVSILLINRSNHTIELKYPSGQRYDLVLERRGREVWRLSRNKGYIQSISYEDLYPDDYLLYSELVDPSNEGFLFGDFRLYAEVETVNGIIRSNVIEISVD